MAGSFGGFSSLAGAPQGLQMAYMRDPRLRLAQQLQLQGADASPVQHWTQGAARLAQALAGNFVQDRADNEYKKQADQYQADIGSLYAPVMQPGAGGAGPRPDAQMRAPNVNELQQRMALMQSPYALEAARPMLQSAMDRQAAMEAEARRPFNLRPGEQRRDAQGNIIAQNPIAERPQAPPAAVAEFQFAQQNGFRGSFMDYQRAQAEARRAPEQGQAGPFAGAGIEAQHFNNLLTLPPSDPRYGVSFNALYGRRAVTQADGTTVEIQPPIPNGIAPPSSNQPQTQASQQASPVAPPQQSPAAPNASPSNVTTVQTPGGAVVTRIGSPREKDLSEAQAKANLFGGQMLRAEGLLSELKAPSNAAIIAWRNAPEGAVNLGLNENDQAYFNALRLFASGVLRKETGAAFTANELLDVQSRFFPMPGDTPRIAAQKAANRKQAQESIRAEMPGGQFRGVVAPPVYGSQDMQGGEQSPAPGAVRTWNPATGKLE